MAVRKTTVGSVLSGFVLAALLAAFFNPPDWGVTSGQFEYVQRVVYDLSSISVPWKAR
jgi:hypothetical protein